MNAPSVDRDLAFGEGSTIRAIGHLLHKESDRLASQHKAIATSLSSQTVASLKTIKKDIARKVEFLEKEQKQRNKERKKNQDDFFRVKDHFQKVYAPLPFNN